MKKDNIPKAKANVFAKHYSNASKLHFSKADRDFNREFKKRLESAPTESVSDFTMGELKRAIKRMKKKGAPGPDNIPHPSSRTWERKHLLHC